MRANPTPPERRLWCALRATQCAGLKFRRQTPIGPYIVDFFCAKSKLVIELDGITHVDPSTDATRTAWLESRGLRVLRFWNNDIMINLDGVLHRIIEAATTP